MNLRGKRVTVVGLGKSGVAACNLLLEKGAEVSITDSSTSQVIDDNVRSLSKKMLSVETGKHTAGLIENRDLIVVSPGVPLDSPAIGWARQKDIPVIGEIELAFAFCPAPIIAITGSNGKTTVATLLGRIFQAAGRRYIVCGNIGNPFAAEVARLSKEHVVILEVSSFQLETIDRFKPNVAAILNLTIDHLDRYANFAQYAQAKSHIFSNQDQEDWAIFNRRDAQELLLPTEIKAKVVYFSENNNSLAGFNDNQRAAVKICSIFNIPEELSITVCREFKGLPHRIEEVRQIQGIKFINDSKATNVDSTLWALNSLNKPVILIAGGKDKGADFRIARDKVKDKLRALVLFGEAKGKIGQAFQGLVETVITTTLTEAVKQAFRLAHPGDCVLLSPMCASFDMFSDYKARGEAFKEVVHNLAQSPKL